MFDGDIFVSHGQMMIENPAVWDVDYDLERSFAGQVNGLCGVGVPERLWLLTGLHTGWVQLTVEHHDHQPASDPQWEDVVEASFTPTGSPLQLMGLMANDTYPLALPAGVTLRVRYSAVRMDAARDGSRGQDDPVLDRYLLQLWPAPPTADAVLRQTSQTAAYWHDYARTLPSQAQLAVQQAERQAQADARAHAEAAERERQRLAHENLLWSGRKPAHEVLEIAESQQLAQYDRGLLDAVVDAAPDRQRAVARFAVRRAYSEAGLTGLRWIDETLDALDRDAPLPAPFDDPAAMWRALAEDRRVPHTSIRSPDGSADNWSQQHMTLPAILAAADPDPLRAAIAALVHCATGVGYDRRSALLHSARHVLSGSNE